MQTIRKDYLQVCSAINGARIPSCCQRFPFTMFTAPFEIGCRRRTPDVLGQIPLRGSVRCRGKPGYSVEEVSGIREMSGFGTYVVGIAADCCSSACRASAYHMLAENDAGITSRHTQDFASSICARVAISIATIWRCAIATCIAL